VPSIRVATARRRSHPGPWSPRPGPRSARPPHEGLRGTPPSPEARQAFSLHAWYDRRATTSIETRRGFRIDAQAGARRVTRFSYNRQRLRGELQLDHRAVGVVDAVDREGRPRRELQPRRDEVVERRLGRVDVPSAVDVEDHRDLERTARPGRFRRPAGVARRRPRSFEPRPTRTPGIDRGVVVAAGGVRAGAAGGGAAAVASSPVAAGFDGRRHRGVECVARQDHVRIRSRRRPHHRPRPARRAAGGAERAEIPGQPGDARQISPPSPRFPRASPDR